MSNKTRRKLAGVDIGATSGRVMKVIYEDGKITYEEVHRFDNLIIEGKYLTWDMEYLMLNIYTGLQKIDEYETIGISTWGCDICLIGEDGALLQNPLCYRNPCFQSFKSKLNYFDVYNKTGIQELPFNTIYQLEYLKTYEEDLLNKTSKILMIPDYIAYCLTSKMYIEETNASTTALYDVKNSCLNTELLKMIGISEDKFPPLIKAGNVYGNLNQNAKNILNKDDCLVVATCTHDTGSAILGSFSKDTKAYLCSGTWSLMGCLLDDLVLSKESFTENFTNEIGFNQSVRYLKNIMGMWIIEEYRRELKNKGEDVSFDRILKDFEDVFVKTIIDVDDVIFLSPGQMSKRINEYALKTNQEVINNRKDIFATIYYSLVFKYKYIFDKLKYLTNTSYDKLNIVGGGSKNELLNQIISDVLDVEVISGPVEATILGNAIVQLLATEEITKDDINDILKNSANIKTFKPSNNFSFKDLYAKYLKIMEEK